MVMRMEFYKKLWAVFSIFTGVGMFWALCNQTDMYERCLAWWFFGSVAICGLGNGKYL